MSDAPRPVRPRGAPLALQVTALMVGSLVVAQAVTLGLTLLLPPAPAPEHPLAEVAAALRGGALRGGGPRSLVRVVRDAPPSLQSVGWTSAERSRAELAALVGAPVTDVRLLFYSPPPFAGAPARTARLADGETPRLYTASLAALLFAEAPPGPAAGGAASAGADAFGGGRSAGAPGAGAGVSRRGTGGGREARPGAGGQPGARDGRGGPTTVPGGGAFRGTAPADAGVVSRYPSHGAVPEGALRGGRAEASLSGAGGAPSAPASGTVASGAGPFSPRAAAAALAATTPGRPLPAPATLPSAPTASAVAGAAAVPRTSPSGSAGAGVAIASGLALGAVAVHELGSHAAPPVRPRATEPFVEPPSLRTDVGPRARAAPDVTLQAPPLLDASAPVTPALAARLSPSQALAVVRGQADRAAADRGGYLLPSAPSPAGGVFGARASPSVEGDFVAALRTAPGRWVTVQPRPEGFPNTWQRRVLLWFALSFAVVAPLGLLFARRLAAPLRDFAAAAERLGKDPSGQHLPLAGPAEVGRAAQAFNRMQGRLKRYIDDRTAMVGAISHDLRTPLARMRFRLERVAPEVRTPVLDDIAQMEEMITSVLIFIRDASEPAVRERVDLRSLLECVVDGAAETGAEAVLDPGDPVPVDVDSLSVQRVVANLIENALKYGEHARVRMYAEGEVAVAEVEDDGPGLPEEEMERVFQPFYRSERARTLDTRGIGLGLAVSRSIARAHGGDVRLLNRGRGLVAQLRLPIAEKVG